MAERIGAEGAAKQRPTMVSADVGEALLAELDRYVKQLRRQRKGYPIPSRAGVVRAALAWFLADRTGRSAVKGGVE